MGRLEPPWWGSGGWLAFWVGRVPGYLDLVVAIGTFVCAYMFFFFGAFSLLSCFCTTISRFFAIARHGALQTHTDSSDMFKALASCVFLVSWRANTALPNLANDMTQPNSPCNASDQILLQVSRWLIKANGPSLHVCSVDTGARALDNHLGPRLHSSKLSGASSIYLASFLLEHFRAST